MWLLWYTGEKADENFGKGANLYETYDPGAGGTFAVDGLHPGGKCPPCGYARPIAGNGGHPGPYGGTDGCAHAVANGCAGGGSLPA